MLIQVGLVLLMLVSVAYAAAVMRKIETDVGQYQRDLRTVEEEHHRLDVACNTLRTLIAQVEDELSKGRAGLGELVAAREQVEAEILALAEAPKQRLFMLDRATLAYGRLWEVTVVNAGGTGAPLPSETAVEWANGRTYIIPGTTDRDARYRAEPRFPPSLGYRIMKVERFRRG
ncbi:hypothetical protein [Niveispirillum fermenti]|uniref:hypothetical protein n=1 Tax=Niveispirillum fermenti TaxID=1233113 RepID=UPI003A8B3B93